MNFAPGSVQKILVLRYRSIGDILLSNPTLKALREKFPKAEIHYLADDLFVKLLHNNPNIDQVVTHHRDAESDGIASQWDDIKLLRDQDYDLAIDLQTGPRGAFTTLLCGATTRLGHPYRLRNRLCYNMYGDPPQPEDHTWQVQFRTVLPLGIKWPDKPEFFLDISDNAMTSQHKRLESEGLMFDRPIVMLHPGARVQTKRWPADLMGELARWLVDIKNMAVILAGSKADEDEIMAIRKASGYALPYFTQLGLSELGAMIKASNMIICNDSGPMHMAGVLGTPTVALFGPSDPTVWAPVGAKKEIVTCDPMECMPCDQKGCDYEGDHCMTRIEVDDVKRAVDKLDLAT